MTVNGLDWAHIPAIKRDQYCTLHTSDAESERVRAVVEKGSVDSYVPF